LLSPTNKNEKNEIDCEEKIIELKRVGLKEKSVCPGIQYRPLKLKSKFLTTDFRVRLDLLILELMQNNLCK